MFLVLYKFFSTFMHCVPKFTALSSHSNKNMKNNLETCIPNFHNPFKNYEHEHWKFITKLCFLN